jgi:heavy metal response regulator
MRILLVEDDGSVARFIQKGLREEGYAVDVATDGEEGWHLHKLNDYDLLIIDLMLPKLDGFELVRRIRRHDTRTPILVLTARAAIQDKVQGLELGADDYLTKPFAFAELVARVRALLRRGKVDRSEPLRCADLMLDPLTRTVIRAGKRISLARTEYALLEFLLRYQGRVVTRTQIMEHVWDAHFDLGSNVVSVYINYLRNKIDKGFDLQLIHTVHGVGYVLTEKKVRSEER